MAGMFARPGGWKMPPPYSEIEDEQAAALQEMQARGGQAPGLGGPMTAPPTAMFGGALQHGVGQIDANMPKPKFFDKNGGWRSVLGAIGDGLSGNPTYANAIEQRRKDARDDQRYDLMMKKFEAQQNKPMPPSTAAKMAAEMGLEPGTRQYAEFIRRYAFKPMILQVPNMQGGTDFTEYDPSGGADTPSAMEPGHVEDGYRFNGGDPSDPNSWSKM